MKELLEIGITLTMIGIFIYGVSYFVGKFVSKVGNDDEQD